MLAKQLLKNYLDFADTGKTGTLRFRITGGVGIVGGGGVGNFSKY